MRIAEVVCPVPYRKHAVSHGQALEGAKPHRTLPANRQAAEVRPSKGSLLSGDPCQRLWPPGLRHWRDASVGSETEGGRSSGPACGAGRAGRSSSGVRRSTRALLEGPPHFNGRCAGPLEKQIGASGARAERQGRLVDGTECRPLGQDRRGGRRAGVRSPFSLTTMRWPAGAAYFSRAPSSGWARFAAWHHRRTNLGI